MRARRSAQASRLMAEAAGLAALRLGRLGGGGGAGALHPTIVYTWCTGAAYLRGSRAYLASGAARGDIDFGRWPDLATGV